MRQHRLKILVGVFLVVLLATQIGRIVSFVGRPLETRRQLGERRAKELEKRQGELARTRRDVQELAFWERRSLPADPVMARSAYQAWLLELIGRVEVSKQAVTLGEAVPRGGLYWTIAASVQARGTLEQWTAFLFEFYRAGHLHQIRSISLTPLGRRDLLDVSLVIEALVLPGADRKDRLTSERSDRLAFDKLGDYHVIVYRNLFGRSGVSDPTDQTYLTGVNQVNGEPQAWFTVRTATDPDQALLKLRQGETLEIGQFRGRVLEIAGEDVVFESDGHRWLITIGENLGQAFALPPEF